MRLSSIISRLRMNCQNELLENVNYADRFLAILSGWDRCLPRRLPASCRMQTAAALKREKEGLFKGKTDSDPCFWQRTKGVSGDQVTAMWHWGISVLNSLWLNITITGGETCRHHLQFWRMVYTDIMLNWTSGPPAVILESFTRR